MTGPNGTNPGTNGAHDAAAELFQLAVIDAAGLLSAEDERRFVERVLAAPSDVRAAVRQIQDIHAVPSGVLPDDEPPASLRARVLAAAEADRSNLRLVGNGAAAEPMAKPASRRVVVQPSTPSRTVTPITPRRRVSAIWRAASIGLAAGLMVVSALSLWFYRQHNGFMNTMLARDTIETLGADSVHDLLFDPQTKISYFVPAFGDVAGGETGETINNELFGVRVSLVQNERWTSAKLYCERLPAYENVSYSVARVAEGDRVLEELSTFLSQGQLTSVTFRFPPELATARLALISFDAETGRRTVIMRANVQIAKGNSGPVDPLFVLASL